MMRYYQEIPCAALMIALCIAAVAPAWGAEPASEAALIEILQSDAQQQAKADACTELKVIGTERAVPALAALLEDPALSHCARYALESMSCDEAGAALVAALAKTDGAVRGGIIASLGTRGERDAVSKLAKLLGDKDTDNACAAAKALGMIGGGKAQRALLRALPGKKGALGEALARGALGCADKLLADGKKSQASKAYDAVFQQCDTPAIRAAAFRGWVLSVGEDAAFRIIDALRSEDAQLRRTAAQLVRTFGGADTTRVFVEAFDSLPESSQTLLLHALADRGDTAARETVQRACGYPSPAVRLAALRALPSLSDKTSVDVLMERAVHGDDASERELAEAALAQLKGPGTDRRLTAFLDQAQSAAAAARVLEQRQAHNAVSALLEAAARYADDAPGPAAIHALGACAQPEDMAALVALVAEAGPGTVDEAQRTVLRLWQRTPQERRDIAPVTSAFKAAVAPGTQARLLETLGNLADDAGLPCIQGVLEHGNAEVVTAALRALSTWPNAKPMPDLLRAARHGTDETHRLLALRGYIALTGRDEAAAPATRLQNLETALSLATRTEEKRLALNAIGTIPTPAAFEAAESCLDKPDLAEDAARALCAIGGQIQDQHAAAVGDTLRRIAQMPLPDDVIQAAQGLLAQSRPAENP